MPDLVLDFSWTHPPVADLLAHQVRAIMFYSRVSTPNPGYLNMVVAAGIGACPIFETGATRAWEGAAAGLSDGRAAAGDLDRIGVPDGVTCYVNMSDTPDIGGNESGIADYARGFASAFPQKWGLGAYGPLVGLRAAQAGSDRFRQLWAVETWGAPPGNPAAHYAFWQGQPGVVLVQMANVPPPIGGTDTNWRIGPLGAWGEIETGEFSMAQMDTLAQWEQDTRKVILDFLVGDERTKGVLGIWMQEQSALIVAAVNKHIDEKFASLPAGGGGGTVHTDEEIMALVEAVVNKTKLTT